MEQSTELSTSLIALITSGATLLTLIGAWIKQKMAVEEIKSDRATTKAARDKDSENLHDTVLKHEFMITQLKDAQALMTTCVDDLRDQTNVLNTNLVKLNVNVENLTEYVKDMKRMGGTYGPAENR